MTTRGLAQTTVEAGAQAALRGYRLQALYILSRVLSDPDMALEYRLEQREDLEIFDPVTGRSEIIQIKAYSDVLTVSKLHEREGDEGENKTPKESYLKRVLSRSAEENSEEVLASFGPYGSRMAGWTSEGASRQALLSTLSSWGFSNEESHTLFSRVSLKAHDEGEIEKLVFSGIRETIAGCDPQTSFELLSAWLFKLSEIKSTITRGSLLARMNHVGQYVADRAAHQKEWFRAIRPLTRDKTGDDIAKLGHGFLEGVSVRFAHIQADLDIARPDYQTRIDEGFETSQMVVVRGASGQGKSCLALRYMHDYIPEHFRFQVIEVEDLQHSLSIARAIIGHLKFLGHPIWVYIDARPGDRAWKELVYQFGEEESVRILLTIREEDWYSSNLDTSGLVVHEIQLELYQEEARQIYEAQAARDPRVHLSFDEAWVGFGSGGPLLEFIFFLRGARTLADRLRTQVSELRDRVRLGKLTVGELDLLKIVAVGTAYGARVNIPALRAALSLPDIGRTLQLFENEYLLRTTHDGACIDGLHAIRSQYLCAILFDGQPDEWIRTAKLAILVLEETDLDVWLRSAFVNDNRLDASLLTGLAPKSWSGYAGCLRALLWQGISWFVRRNFDIISEIRALLGRGYSLGTQLDFGFMDEVAPDLGGCVFEEPAFRSRVPTELWELRAKLETRDSAYEAVKAWLEGTGLPSCSPTSDLEWQDLGFVMFWFGVLKVDVEFENLRRCVAGGLSNAPPFSLESRADFLFGASKIANLFSVDEVQAFQSQSLEAYKDEMRVAWLEQRNSNQLVAHFLMETDSVRRNELNVLSANHVSLLRRLSPLGYERYGCHGYGWGVKASEYDHSQKSVAVDRLPPEWSVRMNSLYNGLVAYLFRPRSWTEHATETMRVRKQIALTYKEIALSITHHFRHVQGTKYVGPIFDVKTTRKIIGGRPSFPTVAVDAWGYFSETAQLTDEQKSNPVSLSLRRHESYLKSRDDYFSSVENTLHQIFPALLAHIIGGDGGKLIMEECCAPDAPYLVMLNLQEAIVRLPRFQDEFRQRFDTSFKELVDFEQAEHSALTSVFELYTCFYLAPSRRLHKPGRVAKERAQARVDKPLQHLKQMLKALDGTVSTRQTERVGLRSIVICFDVPSAPLIFSRFVEVWKAVTEALPNGTPLRPPQFGLLSRYSELIVVPTVAKFSMDRCVWKFPMLNVLVSPQDPERSPQTFHRVELSATELSEIGIEYFDSPTIQDGWTFQNAWCEARDLLGLLLDLNLLQDSESEAHTKIMQEYTTKVCEEISSLLQKSIDSSVRMLRKISSHPDSEIAHATLHFLELIQNSDFMNQMGSGEIRSDLAGLQGLYEQVTEVSNNAVAAACFFADLCLSSERCTRPVRTVL